MDALPSELRFGRAEDAAAIAALSVQVFLDTYATEGIRADLAREAFHEYSVGAFLKRLAEADRKFILAHAGEGLLGFAELATKPRRAPAGHVAGAEIVRLYVQPRAQGRGLGTRLLARAEAYAAENACGGTWLTAWEANARALAFYARKGYVDIGITTHVFEGRAYANRVLAKP